MAPERGIVMRYGVDVGRSGVKISSNGSHVFLPSIVSRAAGDGWGLTASRMREVQVNGVRRVESLALLYNGERWIIGDEQQRMGYSCDNPMGVTKAEPMTRLLAFGGVAAAGVGAVAEICIGLPTALFESELPQMLELMRGEHRFGVDGNEHLVKIKTMVVPEGLGLLVWACQMEDGLAHLPSLRRSTVVMDFGHRTTQLSLFRDLRLAPVGFGLSRAMGGVFEVVLQEAIDERLIMPFPPAAHAVMAQDLIWNGSVNVNGLQVTLDELMPPLQEEARKLWPDIRAAVGRALAGVAYERVVAGGGGAHLLGDELKEMFGERVVLVKDRYAQADGFVHCLEIRRQILET